LLVLALVAVGVALALGGYYLRREYRPPSIVFVLIDTLRADYLGTYGFEGGISPHLDALAGESVVFERCFAQAPWTKPSIASLFTSLEPQTHNVLSHKGKYGEQPGAQVPTRRTEVLSTEATTLAETLQAGGYATAAIVANPWIQPPQGYAQGFDHFEGEFDGQVASNIINAAPVLAGARVWLKNRPLDRPFFLYIHLMDVHGPYDAPEDDYRAVLASPSLGPERPLDAAEMQAIRGYLKRPPWVSRPEAADLRTWRARYAAGVRTLDRHLGVFFDELRDAGMLEHTVVVVTSDHGEELADHGGWDHGYQLHDDQLHVPLIIRLPDAKPRRVSALVRLIDLMPTLVGIARGPLPTGVQGRDLAPFLTGAKTADEKEGAILASGVKWKPGEYAVRTETHKLIATLPDGPSQLFDLTQDPGEQRDVAATEPEVAQTLRAELERHVARPETQARFAPEQVEVPAALQQRLKSLGYVDH
jgi:arylsulfatase A-like enzyme